MRKLIATLTLVLAFTLNANAQDKKELTSSEKGRIEAEAIAKLLDLDENKTTDFQRLFEQKHRKLADKNLTPEKKAELSKIIEMKIRASISDEKFQKLELNKELYKTLISAE